MGGGSGMQKLRDGSRRGRIELTVRRRELECAVSGARRRLRAGAEEEEEDDCRVRLGRVHSSLFIRHMACTFVVI
jgi:hypothetical protein